MTGADGDRARGEAADWGPDTEPDGAAGRIVPAYGRSTLADLLPSVLSAVGVPYQPNPLGLPSASRYVVLLVDGLGWHQLRQCAEDAPYLATLLGDGQRITAGVPSTTATSLVSFGTGLPPGAHGVVGYTSIVPGTRRLLYHLNWDTAVEPRAWQPYPSVFARAVAAGVAVTTVGRRALRGTGLTVAGLHGGSYVGADSIGHRSAATVAASAGEAPNLVYVYEGDLDWTGHQVGCGSAAWREQLAIIDLFAARLRSALPADAVLVVTGDHGMVDVPASRRVDIDAEPALREGVALVGGEARLRHLYTVPGAAGDVAAAWRERLGANAVVYERSEAIAAGWFGPVEDRVADRLGDVIAAALGSFAVECSTAFPVEQKLLGLHGSLTPAEMDVPLLVARGAG